MGHVVKKLFPYRIFISATKNILSACHSLLRMENFLSKTMSTILGIKEKKYYIRSLLELSCFLSTIR